MSRWKLGLVALIAIATFVPAVRSDHQAAAPQETKEQRDARMKWFRDARFGMFIHWGVYSVPAGEWQGNTSHGEWFLESTKMPVSQYEKYAEQFNPVKFDAKEWVRIAKDAGMKYIVITSKHHDGFGMFRSDLTDWCIKSTPFQRDPLKELAAACKEAGITLCFYHSIMDWHHPDWGIRRPWNDKATGTPDMDRYTAYMKGQLKELLTNYGPLGILWFDGQWEDAWTKERGHDLYNYVRGLQPNIIVNNRVGKGDVGDYGTPEQEIPAQGFGPDVDWESCMTLNDHWGYNKHDQNWKSTATLVHNLIDCASKGGNYLLNVGPTSEGLIPGPSVERLAEVGEWMKANGEAVYDTSASPFKKLAWGRCTQKPGKLYLHVFEWPKDGKLVVPMTGKVTKAYLLCAPEKVLKTSAGADSMTIEVPGQAPDALASVVVAEIEGDVQPAAISMALAQAQDGTLKLTADEAEIVGQNAKLEGGSEPNIGFWTNPKDSLKWKAVVSRPGKFDVEVVQACDKGTGGAEYSVQIGDQSVKGTVQETGSWQSYKSVSLGSVEIAKTGPVAIELKPTKTPGFAVMNLRAVVLKPAK